MYIFKASFYTDEDYGIRNNYVPVDNYSFNDYQLVQCFIEKEKAFEFAKEFLNGLKENIYGGDSVKYDLYSMIDKSISKM